MAEGRRWSPENPSPAMKSFAAYIKDKGYDDSSDLETTVAATFVFHREWQAGHATELVAEREAAKQEREAEKAKKAEDREAKKAEREEAKKVKEAEKEQKRQEREAAKAAKEAEGADGDDTPAEPAKTSRRLKVKDEAPEPVGASSSTF